MPEGEPAPQKSANLRVTVLLPRADYFRLKAIGEEQDREISQQLTYAVRQWLASQPKISSDPRTEQSVEHLPMRDTASKSLAELIDDVHFLATEGGHPETPAQWAGFQQELQEIANAMRERVSDLHRAIGAPPMST